MPNIGLQELIVILMIVVLVFGASRLPQIGEGLGRAIKNLKQGMASDDRIEVSKGGSADEETTTASASAKAGKVEEVTAEPDGASTAASSSEQDVSDAELVDKG